MNLFTGMHVEPVQDITAMDLNKKLSPGNKPTLRAVRQPVEFRSGHITGAQLIPLGELKTATRISPGDGGRLQLCHQPPQHTGSPHAGRGRLHRQLPEERKDLLADDQAAGQEGYARLTGVCP